MNLFSRPKASETERFARLPRWVQEEIVTLENLLQRAEEQRAKLLTPTDQLEDGAPIVGDYTSRRGLGLDVRNVGFRGSPIVVSYYRGDIQVRTEDGSPLHIIPEVTNAVRVRPERRS